VDVPLDPLFDAFAVAAVVTPPGGDAVATSGIWVTSTTEDWPTGAELKRRELRRVFALRRDEADSVPLKTLIEAPDYGSTVVRRWRVDGFERVDPDILRVVVVPAPDEET
jgi:hypothetical protein